MHALFEVEEVARHVAPTGRLDDGRLLDPHAIRVGLALTGLATGAHAAPLASSWQRLAGADRSGMLQVLLDGHGVPRGYAILALLTDADDAALRADPTLIARIDHRPDGAHAWLRALSGGEGHGWAIARHLRDGILHDRDAVGVVRARGARRIALHRPGLCRRRTRPPLQGRFAEFRQALGRAARFHHYARLLAASDPAVTVAAAHDRFSHADALLQYRFDRDDDPRAYVNWAMVDEQAATRSPATLRAGDWRGGARFRLVDALGDAAARTSLMARLAMVADAC